MEEVTPLPRQALRAIPLGLLSTMWTRFFCCGLLLGAQACDSCGGARRQPTPIGASEVAPEASTVVTGRVRLADGTSLPRYTLDEMERKVLTQAPRGEWPSSCTPPKLSDREPVKLTPDGFLQGVVVAASDFKGAKPRPPRVHEVRIEDCRLSPSLVVALKGDTLRIRNTVDFPFMPSLAYDEIARTLMPGQHFETELGARPVDALRCGYTAPCGRTDVLTVLHPLYAITDEDGRFRIEDFPADQVVKLHAWHPLFQESELSVELQRGQTREVELVLTPVVRPTDAGVADAGHAAE